MPNGAPGDHPISDIIIHKIPIYSDEINCLVLDCSCIINKLISTGAWTPPSYWYGDIDSAFNLFASPDLIETVNNLKDLRKKLQVELDTYCSQDKDQ